MLLHMCSLAMIHLSACYYYISDVRILLCIYYVSSVRIVLYVCPRATLYVSAYSHISSVLTLLYVCPRTTIYVSAYSYATPPSGASCARVKAPQPHRNIFSKLKKKPTCGSKLNSQPHRIYLELDKAPQLHRSMRERVNEPSTFGSKLNSCTAGARLQLDEDPQPHLKVQGMPDARKAAKALVRFIV
jgi:hypothetical protein